MSAIVAALKSFLPGLIEAIIEAATSKKALAAAGTIIGVHAAGGDWKTQAITGTIGAVYTLAQAHVDAAKIKTAK